MAPSIKTLAQALDEADPNLIADAIRQSKLGTMLTPLKRTFTGLTAAASFDLTTIDGTGETVGVTNPNRLPALLVENLRITASGTAGSVGSYVAGDVGAVMIVPPGGASVAVGVARISDDGKTVTFPNTVTAFVISYLPAAARGPAGLKLMTDAFERSV